jgi:hypothetical protein
VQLLQGVHDLKGIVKQYICKGVISRALTATDAEKPKEIGGRKNGDVFPFIFGGKTIQECLEVLFISKQGR